jgi:hypothetical protein
MIPHKMLVLTSLVLLMLPLRHAELLSRAADGCKCDLNDLGCKIVCSGVGSGRGTGGGTSTFDVAPLKDGSPPERPIVVPRTNVKSMPQQMKQ